jgi:hypothetical protein
MGRVLYQTIGPGPPKKEEDQKRFLADVLRGRQGLAGQSPQVYFYQPHTLPMFPTEEDFAKGVTELTRKR